MKFFRARASGIVFVCAVFVGMFYVLGNVGITDANLKSDVRRSSQIQDEWITDGTVSDTMAAYISYPHEMNDHTFSVYVNRPGLSFEYFFRGGGSLASVEREIAEFTVEGCLERSFISMNQQHVSRLEIDDGNTIQVVDIDSNKPFAMVLPVNAGNISFFDVNGK